MSASVIPFSLRGAVRVHSSTNWESALGAPSWGYQTAPIRRGRRFVTYCTTTATAVVVCIPRLLAVITCLIWSRAQVMDDAHPKSLGMLGERALSPHSFLLPIIVDGRSRGIVRTDPIPKPGVS